MPKMVEIFKRDVKTNIPLGDMTSYLTKLPNFSSNKIHSYILPGEYKNDGISWYMADEEQLPEIVDRLFAEYKLTIKPLIVKTTKIMKMRKNHKIISGFVFLEVFLWKESKNTLKII